MIRDINEKIKECREDMILKETLEKKLFSLRADLDEKEKELYILEKNLAKELKDVQKLKSLSFLNFIASVLRNKEEKIEKEEKEYLEAKLKYDYFKSSVDSLRNDVENTIERLGYLRDIDNRYTELIKEKRDLIKKLNFNVRDEIIALEEQIKDLLSEKTEVSEALNEVYTCKSLSKDVEASLDSAHGWGIYDMVGGGLVSSVIKHNRIDDAKSDMDRLGYAVERLNKELSDLNTDIFRDSLNISSFSHTLDIFFDNIFTDMSIQGEINDSLNRIGIFQDRLKGLAIKLEDRENIINIRVGELNDKIDSIIENIN